MPPEVEDGGLTETCVEVAAGVVDVGGDVGVCVSSSVTVNELLERAPGDAMTSRLESTMSTGAEVTDPGADAVSLTSVNCALPKYAKSDCSLLTVGASSIHSAEDWGAL